MVGVSGNIDPGSTDFTKYLNHFHRDPLFRAIRSSRFYSRDASGKVALNPAQVANLKLLAQADLALDTANPSMDLMNANVMLADAVPDLRIIMDHLPSFDPSVPGPSQAAYEAVIKEMAARPNIFVKLTEVYHPTPATTASSSRTMSSCARGWSTCSRPSARTASCSAPIIPTATAWPPSPRRSA